MGRKVTTTELKSLLYDIRDRRPDVRVRVRVIGKMWSESFCTVNHINENGMILCDAHKGKLLYVSNVNDIIQFELECSFFGFHAFYHYNVVSGESVIKQSLFHSTDSLPSTR
jgi:hypothetical protein